MAESPHCKEQKATLWLMLVLSCMALSLFMIVMIKHWDRWESKVLFGGLAVISLITVGITGWLLRGAYKSDRNFAR